MAIMTSTESSSSSGLTLTLSAEEREQLLSSAGAVAVRDTHVEARRTESPDFREQVHHQEDVLRGLIGKLRRP